MRDLSNITNLHRGQLESEYPWIWLYELETDDDPPQRYRLTNFTSSVQFGANAAGDPLVYSPAPIVHGDIETTSDGSLPTMTVTIANSGVLAVSTVDTANGWVGRPVRLMLVSAAELDNPDAAITEDAEIESVSIQRDGLTFTITALNIYQQQFPPYIYARRRCRFIYGGAECGFNLNAPGVTLLTCPRTEEACEVRGDDEVARGLARLHPKRFGGWPGIPRVGR